MDKFLMEIVDPDRLASYVKLSLGNLDKLRKVSNALRNNPLLYEILEDELLARVDLFQGGDSLHGDCREYLDWLCCILNQLTKEKWTSRLDVLWTAICEAEQSFGSSLLKLALQSDVIAKEELLNRLNEVPPAALIHGMRAVQDDKFPLDVAIKLRDDTTFIKLLVDVMTVRPSQVDSILSNETLATRLDVALKALHDTDDACLKRSSLTLVKQLLCKRGVAGSELIVNMLSAAEQKQVHLIEPVLLQFVDATRTSAISDISWILCAFQRLFLHHTTWVRATSLQKFLSLHDFHRQVFENRAEAFYTSSFLDAIDQLSLYARTETCALASPSPIGSGLREWLEDLERSVRREQFKEFIVNLLRKVCSRNSWNSVALLYMSEAILSLHAVPVLSDLQPIQASLNIWSFQEPLVRRYIVRLWLQIACKFSTEIIKTEQLGQLASQFVEDIDVIREHIIPLKVPSSTSVGLCQLAWTKADLAAELLDQELRHTELWQQLLKVRAVPSAWVVLKRAIEIGNALPTGLALLTSSDVSESDKNTIVDVLAATQLSRELLEEAVTVNFDWRLLYLWSQVATNDSAVNVQCFSHVSKVLNWAEMFGKPSIAHMIRTLTNLAFVQAAESYRTTILERTCSLLPLTPRPMIADLLRLVRAYLSATSERKTLERILKVSWMSCLETRKATTLFAECVSVFMTLLFNGTMHAYAFDSLVDTCTSVREYVDGVPWFGEMFFLAMIDFVEKQPQSVSGLCGQLALGLCYGPIFRKDQKVVLDTERYLLRELAGVEDFAKLRSLTECEAAINVRAKCVSFASKVKPDEAWQLIEAVRAYERSVSSTRKRYFNNSNIHRVKTRAWQAILVLLDATGDMTTSEDFLQDIIEQLKNDSHQMTVRILMEWCAVKVILRWRLDVVKLISTAIEKASAERIGSICSYLNILMHVCCAAPNCALIARGAPLVLPWTMTQHFSVRVHAQFVFRRMLGLCHCEPRCHTVYQPQLDALQRVVNYGGGAKNATKLDGDFYMSESILPDCETYDLVFDKIPRAYGLADIDCVPRTLFVDESTWMKDSGREVNTELKIEVVDENCSRPDVTATVQEDNYQRKIVPVSVLLEEDGRLSSPPSNVKAASRNDSEQSQLVVVASLIDRLPNLGGICRTAEIFAVSELAMANVKILDMKEFHNLSVSSHHWLPIRGVPPSAIEDYLREKKAEGFTLIGVEQTARSVSLNNFTFPKKSLLLLGNEKEGLPPRLIHEVDHCVEIPQQGVVRSLNVHVSAALLIWEFRKQHMPSTSTS